ncbi:MAG: phosphomethylpyrimidine synthase ThiC, partial [Chloroflexi bacterium]
MAEAPAADRTASGTPIRGSRKAHLQGSRPDLRVPVREILLGDGDGTGVFRVYDSSGPYTDPGVCTDVRRGLPSVRGA